MIYLQPKFHVAAMLFHILHDIVLNRSWTFFQRSVNLISFHHTSVCMHHIVTTCCRKLKNVTVDPNGIHNVHKFCENWSAGYKVEMEGHAKHGDIHKVTIFLRSGKDANILMTYLQTSTYTSTVS
jgi:hypothetical protein